MHVAQLLHPLIFRVHHKVIKTRLPEMAAVEDRVPQTPCRVVVGGMSAALCLRRRRRANPCFCLHHLRWVAALRLPEQEVHVLRHDA